MKNDSNYRLKKCLSLIQTSWGDFFGIGHWSDFRTWNSNNILEKYGKSWWSTDSVLRWWIDWCNSGYTMVILPRLWSSPFGLPKKKSPFSTRLVVLELHCQVAPVPHQLGTSSSKLVIGSPIFVSWFCSFPSLIFGILPLIDFGWTIWSHITRHQELDLQRVAKPTVVHPVHVSNIG